MRLQLSILRIKYYILNNLLLVNIFLYVLTFIENNFIFSLYFQYIGETAIINATYKRAIQELYASMKGKKNEMIKLLISLGMEMTSEVCVNVDVVYICLFVYFCEIYVFLKFIFLKIYVF